MADRCSRLRWLVSLVIAAGFALVDTKPGCADIPGDEVRIGISGFVKVGLSAPVQVLTKNAAVQSIVFEAVDPLGNIVSYPLQEIAIRGMSAGRLFRGRFRCGRLDGSYRLVYKFGDGQSEIRRLKAGPDENADVHRPLRQSALLVMTLGKPRGFGTLSSFGRAEGDGVADTTSKTGTASVQLVELDDAGRFPGDVRDLAAVNVVVHAGDYKLDPDGDRALRRWVAEGGHLIISRGRNLTAFRRAAVLPAATAATGAASNRSVHATDRLAGPDGGSDSDRLLAGWLPITVLGQLQLKDLTELETYVGRSSPIIFNARVPAARIRDPKDEPYGAGTTLLTSRTGPLIVKVPYGLGLITFCAIDFDQPPLTYWANIDSLGIRLLEETLAEFQSQLRSGKNRLSQNGVSDLGTQLHAIQESFPSVERMSAWQTIGLLLFYIALIGPFDYLIVHRVLKRPRLTWVTFPVLVILATVLSVRNASVLNGDSLQMNVLQIVDIDATDGGPADGGGRQRLRNTVWMTVYSPETQRFHLKLRPVPLARQVTTNNGRQTEPSVESPTFGWTGVNESVFGGMHRAGGLDIGRLVYSIPPDSLSIDALPIHLWSTRSIAATWRTDADRLIDSRLAIDDSGRLSGAFTHHLPVPIEDWVLVHGNHIFRADHDETAAFIPPDQPFSPAQSDIISAGLLSVLKKTRLRTKPQFTRKPLENANSVEQIAYQADDKDLYRFVTVMSFHQAIGGRNYTGLDGFSLRNYDLSRLLPLNRAVLIGRIRRPVATLHQRTPGRERPTGSTELKPTRSETFVRIVLPVRKRRNFDD